MILKNNIDRFAADPEGLQRFVGITIGTVATVVVVLNVLTQYRGPKASLSRSSVDWHVLAITIIGLFGLISGFWKVVLAKWTQIAIFFITAILNSLTTTSAGDVTGGIFLLFGLILIAEYRLGHFSIWLGAVFTVIIYPIALIFGYRSYASFYLFFSVLSLIGVVALILLYGAVLYRHEFRHRQDLALLETRVKERTVELEHALEERFAMLQEIHHRVKNNLQVIISLLRLEADRQGDSGSRASLEASVQRILAMALVHETLYDTDQLDKIDIVSYAKRLIEETRAAASAEFELEAEGATLVGLDFAVPFGLLLNELMSNSEKHAFPAGTRGKVVIRIESKDGIVLRVEDNGIGMSEDVHIDGPKTLGLNLVKVLAQQLGGKISLDRKSGTRWTIRFPSTEPVIRH